MRRSGGRWVVEPTPGDATENGTSGLTGVSCPTAGTCTAVGENAGGGPLAMHWDGLKWRTQTAADELGVLGFNGSRARPPARALPSAAATAALERLEVDSAHAVLGQGAQLPPERGKKPSARHCTAVGSA
jgi:hypothetical protein